VTEEYVEMGQSREREVTMYNGTIYEDDVVDAMRYMNLMKSMR
jgi:hypothetical protein